MAETTNLPDLVSEKILKNS